MTIASTILEQLGGNRFAVMTGAKHFTSDGSSLIFKLARGAKDGINAVRITLDPNDTYTITFYRQKRAPTFEVLTVRELADMHAEDLQRIFTDVTGLATRL